MLTVFIVALVLSFILTIPTIYFAKKYNLVTDKEKRMHPAHTHKGIIPRGGGIPIFIAILITVLIFLPLNKIMFGILLASFLLILMGVLDDYLDLSPYSRFVGNLIISIIVVSFGLGIPYISNPFGDPIRLDQWQLSFDILGKHNVLVLADIVAVIWLTAIMNMINWSKGVDGQMPGFVGIAAIFLGFLSQRFTGHDISIQTVTLFSFIIAGSFLGFLPFNFYPQKIMPGYGGGALAGFLLGILSILSFGKVGTAVFILAIPMIDAFYTIVRRIIKKQSPFRADWGHLHHKLLEIRWGKRRIAVFYYLITFILGLVSLRLQGIEKLIGFISIAIMLLIFIFLLEKIKKTDVVKYSNNVE
ncbi:MAG: undecaprenyl/decaprenyl-phosphate alpha-N-acetylglucosaminyl 1-phosphate transferase [Candidatus Roizmanbacteria bacterium]|nr:MAG: undecaprenyl/decaprenyl-phosphate alpha-N-acetylglucosaminyl 1-phosphate transferase [Candidatus Roizmanbacteria bacterium]